ncbi:MAG TPA: YciI family protein [Polyangiaceae bacterium]|nr:YciI family protein [Polyangiaceae bacterium]
MKFMLMMNAPRGKSGDWSVVNWTHDELKAHVGFMVRFNKELRAEGVLVGAEGLASPREARIVRAGKAGAPEVTDGPFAESKEFLAGYWIVDVESAQQAYGIAARASAAPGPGGAPLNMPIEVREVMSGPPVEP